MKIIKRIFLAIVTIILALLLIFNIYNFICLKILKQDLTSIRGYALLEVVSGSMEPTIHVGDMIIIDTNSSHYEVGDIITFYDVNGNFVTHRILWMDDSSLITKGDYNDSEDNPISMDKIVGKYVCKIPLVGRIISSFKTPFVMVMILIIGFMVCYMISTDKEGKPILTEEEIARKEEQEFLEFKLWKAEQERLRKEEEEYQEFLEYKRRKEEEERKRKEEQEYQEFLEYKRMKEQVAKEEKISDQGALKKDNRDVNKNNKVNSYKKKNYYRKNNNYNRNSYSKKNYYYKNNSKSNSNKNSNYQKNTSNYNDRKKK